MSSLPSEITQEYKIHAIIDHFVREEINRIPIEKFTNVHTASKRCIEDSALCATFLFP